MIMEFLDSSISFLSYVINILIYVIFILLVGSVLIRFYDFCLKKRV